jgi:hypothetical protein
MVIYKNITLGQVFFWFLAFLFYTFGFYIISEYADLANHPEEEHHDAVQIPSPTPQVPTTRSGGENEQRRVGEMGSPYTRAELTGTTFLEEDAKKREDQNY